MLYKDEIVAVVVDGALTLLNLPGAIQQQATLNPFEATELRPDMPSKAKSNVL